jgi:ADP-ribose pyrophosphatase YjhB (NUDIX family)
MTFSKVKIHVSVAVLALVDHTTPAVGLSFKRRMFQDDVMTKLTRDLLQTKLTFTKKSEGESQSKVLITDVFNKILQSVTDSEIITNKDGYKFLGGSQVKTAPEDMLNDFRPYYEAELAIKAGLDVLADRWDTGKVNWLNNVDVHLPRPQALLSKLNSIYQQALLREGNHGLIVSEDRETSRKWVLLIWNEERKWHLPGGATDKGEFGLRALIREIHEEIGFGEDINLTRQAIFGGDITSDYLATEGRLDKIKHLGGTSLIHNHGDNINNYTATYALVGVKDMMKTKKLTPKLKGEIKHAAWFRLSDLVKLSSGAQVEVDFEINYLCYTLTSSGTTNTENKTFKASALKAAFKASALEAAKAYYDCNYLDVHGIVKEGKPSYVYSGNTDKEAKLKEKDTEIGYKNKILSATEAVLQATQEVLKATQEVLTASKEELAKKKEELGEKTADLKDMEAVLKVMKEGGRRARTDLTE